MKTGIRVAVNSLVGLVVFGLLLFGSAGTFECSSGSWPVTASTPRGSLSRGAVHLVSPL
jgi:hypothetical protein